MNDPEIDIDILDDNDQDTSLKGASGNGYAWEDEYKRSWDILQEDEKGSLQGVVSSIQHTKRRRLLKDTSTIQRGIIRNLFVIIDLSNSMAEKDLKPSRRDLTFNLLEQFINEYFDQNPISQLGIIVTRDGLSEKLTELSGNSSEHIEELKVKINRETRGEPSLQNSLELAKNSLCHSPPHGTREILILMASLTTCDPGDINETIRVLKNNHIRVSIIGLAAEVQICKRICQETKGTYGVVLNEAHYKDILFEMIPPPSTTSAKTEVGMIEMGFPRRITERFPTACACHQRPIQGGNICPRCFSKACELPTKCAICGLTLVSSPHLARSYHHLFPVPNYIEVPRQKITSASPTYCFGCQQPFENIPTIMNRNPAEQGSGRYECPQCLKQFCVDCDIYIHDVLHNCPSCIQSKK
ncbi:hypothetical protein PIROE2DRAFT_63340 [Piromyces sp. E2]|nr:hypothetical protein PIROE2DRAFT_63340 [Piromyces sp. E2]|eukprot:OUM60143.1 hypothetical protein PIROE2DRAFT_63340 [Piromyces sp. E2]